MNPALSHKGTSPGTVRSGVKGKTFITAFFLFLLAGTPLLFLINVTKNPFLIQGVLVNVGMSILGLFAVLAVLRGEITMIPSTLERFWLGWFLAAVLSFISCLIHNTRQVTAVAVMWLGQMIFLLTNCVFVFYAGFRLGRDYVARDRIIHVLFLVGFIAAGYGLLQYYGLEPLWKHELRYFEGRLTSTFGNPAFLATFLVLIIPVNLAHLSVARQKTKKMFLIVLFFLTLATVLATSARSAWLGLLVAIMTFIYYSWKAGYHRELCLALRMCAVGLCLGILLLVFSHKKSLVVQRSSWKDIAQSTSIKQRVLIWSCAAEMFICHPFLGQGFGLFELFYPSYQGKYLQSEAIAPLKTHANHAHNEILHIAGELGLTGLLLGFYFLNVFFRKVKRIISSSLPFQEKIIAYGLVAGVAGVMVDSLLNVALHIVSPALFFWLGVGLIFSYHQEAEGKIAVAGAKKLFRTVFLLISIPILVIVPFLTVSHFAGEVYFFDGITLLAKGDKLLSGDNYKREVLLSGGVRKLEQATRIFPWNHETAYELAGGCLRQKNFHEAAQWYRRAETLNFSYDEIYYMLGLTEFSLGNLKAAEKALLIARSLHPQGPHIKEMLNKLTEVRKSVSK